MSCILIFKVKEDSLKVRRSVKVVELPVWKLLSLMNKQAFEKWLSENLRTGMSLSFYFFTDWNLIIWYLLGHKPRKITLSSVCTEEFSKTQYVIPILVWLHRSFPTFHPHNLSYARRQVWRYCHKTACKYSKHEIRYLLKL